MAIKINKNSVGNIEANKTDNTIVDSDNGYDESSLYFKDIYDFKELKKFIKHIEKKFRSSEYYSKYIGDLRNNKGLHFDANKGKLNDSFVEIEFHHYPFTLYDITKTVLMDYLKDDTSREINPYEIAETIMKLHYELIVGLVPLSITMHQLVHAGKKFINLKYVNQSYLKFIARYSNVMDPNLISNWRNLQMLSEQDDRGELAEEDYLEEVKLILHIDNIEKPEAIKTENEVIA